MPIRQHHLSRAIDDALLHQLTTAAPSTRARALALSTALPHAGDWLIGVPSAALGLRLQDREFRACLRYWLGVPLHSSPYVCPECKATADEYGTTKWVVEGMGTGSIATTLFEMSSTQLPSLLPWLHCASPRG